jgi:CheY-like chemotaxis protein
VGSALAGVRVLIVEDEPLVAIMLEEMLEELGANVAANAMRLEEALLLAADCDFDAAVLDVNLSGARSYPVADKLRERGIPFVFATGYGSSVLAGSYEADRLIHKPYSLTDVERALRDMIGTR